MADKQYGATSALGYVLHLTNGLLLKFGITNSEDFVNNEDLGFQEGGDGKAEADGHTRGETLDGGIEVALNTSEVDNLVELLINLMPCHAHDAAVHVDILPCGHLGVEASADLKKGGDASTVGDMANGGGGDMAEELQQSAFAGTVLTDDADDIALLDLERDVLQGPNIVTVALCRAVVDLANLEIGVLTAQNGSLPPAVDVVLQGAGAYEAKAVLLADIIKMDGNVLFHCILAYV